MKPIYYTLFFIILIFGCKEKKKDDTNNTSKESLPKKEVIVPKMETPKPVSEEKKLSTEEIEKIMESNFKYEKNTLIDLMKKKNKENLGARKVLSLLKNIKNESTPIVLRLDAIATLAKNNAQYGSYLVPLYNYYKELKDHKQLSFACCFVLYDILKNKIKNKTEEHLEMLAYIESKVQLWEKTVDKINEKKTTKVKINPEQEAYSMMMTINSSQTSFRNQLVIDQDDDGVGEYGTFKDLAGTASSVRYGGVEKKKAYVKDPVMSRKFGKTNEKGHVLVRGYYYVMYLLILKRDTLLNPNNKTNQQIIDMQEMRYLVMAWPEKGNGRMFFITQAGTVYFADNYKNHIQGSYPTPLDVFKTKKEAVLQSGNFKTYWRE